MRLHRHAAPRVAAALLLLAAPAAARAQAAPATLRVEGRVLLPSGRGPQDLRPVPDTWVVVHRVGEGAAGAVDSARTDAAGRYAITYQRTGGDSTVYFASAAYAGITYFSQPLPAQALGGGEADLVVYDTTSRGVSLDLRGRHVVVGARDSSQRHSIVEVFEVANDSAITVVAAGDAPAWSIRLPERTQSPSVAGGDVSAEAVRFEEGEVRVLAPFAPGIKQLSIAYSLPAAAFPVSIPLQDSVAVFEVLVEQAEATVDGALLAPTDSVNIDGRVFRRWISRGAPANAVVRIGVPAPPADSRSIYVVGILLALGTLMLLALGRSVRRPTPAPLGWNGATGPAADELARRVAALDAAFQRRRSPTEAERQEYERQRGGLKAQLADALARGDS